MRPRSYARKPTDARMSSRTHPRAHTYIHPCTHTYARIRAREGNFLTTNLLYSIVKPSSIINPSAFTSIIQPLYNPYQYWHHIGCVICTNCQHLSSSTTYLPSIRNYLLSSNHIPTVSRPSVAHNSPSSRAYHIPFLSDFHSNQLTTISICQSVIKLYQFSIY